MDITNSIGKEITLVGVAREAKGGPVIVTEDNTVVYIRDIELWPDNVEDKEIQVKGILKWEKFIPDPVVDEDGAISTGAYGDQLVLKESKYELI